MAALVVVLPGAATARAESGGEPHFQVEYSNPALVPAQWTMEIRPDGSGHFKSERGQAEGRGIEPPDVDRDIQLTPHFARRAFDVAVHKKLFSAGCESHMKVAYQGTKRLTYSGPAGQGSCEFNYSKDAEIQGLSDSLIAVATTLIEGARLQALLLHDRLGLDKEMEVLAASAADGRAQQIGSIREILERLAEDPAVLDRVKRRARTLLTKADGGA